MATIQQIEKQIATANKNIAGYEKRIAMYTERRDNAIAKINKMGANVSVDDIIATETKIGRYTDMDFTMPAEIRDAYGWDACYKITDNCRSIYENERHLRNETIRRDNLVSVRDKMIADANAHEQATAGLKSALEQAMAEFRVEWFAKMKDWHERHFNHVNEVLPTFVERFRRAGLCESYFTRKRSWRWSQTSRIAKFLTATIRSCNEIIQDDAARMTFGEYMANAEQETIKSWNNGIDLLTDKCHKFGLDEQAIEITHPIMTGKGFSAIIRDNKSRIVDVRVILAAEYSVLVTPHIRYIATQRSIE